MANPSRLENFDSDYNFFASLPLRVHASNDAIDVVQTTHIETTKHGNPARRDQRVISLRVIDYDASKEENEDARHEIHIGADGLPIAIGGTKILSPDDAVLEATVRLRQMRAIFERINAIKQGQ